MIVRVALAGHDDAVREGVPRLLADAREVAVVATCASHDDLWTVVGEHRPDVVVTDVGLAPTANADGASMAAVLRDVHPAVGVVVLGDHLDPVSALGLLEPVGRGRAYLARDRVTDRAQLLSAILAAAVGGALIDPRLIEPLIVPPGAEDPPGQARLTRREREVLAEIAHGHSNAAIAESMFLTKRAVEKHINSIFLKLELGDEELVSRRVKAALLYHADARSVR